MANRYPLVLNGTTVQELQSGDTIIGDAIFTNLTVSADASIGGDISVTGSGTFVSEVDFGGPITVSGIADINNTLYVNEVAEAVNLQTTNAASGTITVDWLDGGVVHMGTATSNFGINIRGASGVSLNSILATGEAAGLAVLIPQGDSGYSQTFVSIDGVTASPFWQGGVTGTFYSSGIDVIGLEVIKLGSASYTVLESVTQFKK